eukprot:6783421-Pyramimonas_sp.AAC.2
MVLYCNSDTVEAGLECSIRMSSPVQLSAVSVLQCCSRQCAIPSSSGALTSEYSSRVAAPCSSGNTVVVSGGAAQGCNTLVV